MNYLKKLQNWYTGNCNGDWEHSWGVSISTLDNPGWHIEINLNDTCLQNAYINISEDNGEDDWYIIKTEDKKYVAHGDYQKLEKILQIFFDEFLPGNKDDNFLYTLYLPVSEVYPQVFRPLKASMVNEETFRIREINKLLLEKENIKFSEIEDLDGFDADIAEETINYRVNDLVTCQYKYFFNGGGLVIKDFISYSQNSGI